MADASDSGLIPVRADGVNVVLDKKKKMPLEPAIAFIFFGLTLTGAVYANLIVFRTCYVALGYKEEDCALLGTPNASASTQRLEEEVQPYSARVIMAISLVEALVPAMLSLVIGPWSDKHGRKPLIISAFIGYTTIFFLGGVLACFSTLGPWWFVLAAAPVAFSGGQCALITGVLCYITDTVQEKNRALRMGILEATIYFGLMLGTLTSAPLYAAVGGASVLWIASGSVLIGLLYVIIVMKESVTTISEQSRFRSLCELSLVSAMFNSCLVQRPRGGRPIVWLVIITLGTSIMVLGGSGNINYLFAREKFHWTITEYTRYDALSIVVTIVGTGLGLYVLKRLLGMSEAMLCLLGLLSSVADAFIKAFASKPWHMYLGSSVSFLRGVSGPMGRAILANTVPVEDIGKVFSLTTSVESILPLAATPVYTALYGATLDTFPGAYYLMTGAVYSTDVILIGFVYFIQRKYSASSYARMENDEQACVN